MDRFINGQNDSARMFQVGDLYPPNLNFIKKCIFPSLTVMFLRNLQYEDPTIHVNADLSLGRLRDKVKIKNNRP